MRRKRIIFFLFFILFYNYSFLYSDDNDKYYSIIEEVSFDKKEILANYLDFIIDYSSGNSFDLTLVLSPYNEEISKSLGANYTIGSFEHFSFYMGFLYNFPLEGYKNFNINSGFNFSFGENFNFQPGLNFTFIRYSQYFEDFNKTFRFSQFDLSPEFIINFSGITTVYIEFLKSIYSINIKNIIERSGYRLMTILYRYPNLGGTVSEFINNSFSITINQMIWEFLDIDLGFTKINYLIEGEGKYYFFASNLYLTEQWSFTPAINFSQVNDDNNFSFSIKLSYRW